LKCKVKTGFSQKAERQDGSLHVETIRCCGQAQGKINNNDFVFENELM
jgi:hypothetical protein